MSVELVERCRAVATSTWSDALDQLGVVADSERSWTSRRSNRRSTFSAQRLRWIDPKRTSQRNRARRESNDKHQAVRGKEQQHLPQ